jgi:hypothetical protein
MLLQSLRTMRAGGRLATLCGGRRRRRLRMFPPRRSSRSQVGKAMATISKRKHKRFDIEAYYRNKTKTFLFGPLMVGTKAECFNLFQNCLKSKWKFKNESELIFIASKCFHIPRLQRKQNGTFAN